MPMFDGGAMRAQVRAQQAALDQARVAYQGVVLTALKDVEDALVALRGDRERLAHLQRAAEAAGNAALLARHRYEQRADRLPDRARDPAHQLSAQDSVANAQRDSAPTTCACTRRWAAAGARRQRRRPPLATDRRIPGDAHS